MKFAVGRDYTQSSPIEGSFVSKGAGRRADISELRHRIEQSGARTLGEYLARRRKKGKSVRARPGMGLYPDRAMYEEEFDKI